MRTAAKFLTAGAFALLIAAGPAAQQPPAGQAPAGPQPTPTFRASVDLITTDMIARDSRTEQFIADLKPS